jgi:hypothetical protein
MLAQVPKIGIIHKDSIVRQSHLFQSTTRTLQNYTFLLQYILEKKQLAGQILLQKLICRPRKCFSLDSIPSDQVLLEQYQANISTLAQQAEQNLLEMETKIHQVIERAFLIAVDSIQQREHYTYILDQKKILYSSKPDTNPLLEQQINILFQQQYTNIEWEKQLKLIIQPYLQEMEPLTYQIPNEKAYTISPVDSLISVLLDPYTSLIYIGS